MKRARGRPGSDRAGEARRRILDAAADEFADVGYEGATVESIAHRADCNRALVYFHFGDKAGLFRAVLDDGNVVRQGQMAGQPSTLSEALRYWFEQNMSEPRRIRLVMQEALAQNESLPVPEHRAEYLDRQLAAVREFQARGLLRSDLDARHLLTIILALTSFPACFPRIATTSLGQPDAESMFDEWLRCLEQIAVLLRPA